MTEMYGHRFVSQNGDSPTPSWSYALAGLSPDSILVGLKKMAVRFVSWPPNPLEFRALCIPEASDYGLPSVNDAYRIAQVIWCAGKAKYAENHPMFYHAARHGWISPFEFKRCDTEKEARAMIQKILNHAVEHISLGRVFDECPESLEKKAHPPITGDEASEMARNLLDELGLGDHYE